MTKRILTSFGAGFGSAIIGPHLSLTSHLGVDTLDALSGGGSGSMNSFVAGAGLSGGTITDGQTISLASVTVTTNEWIDSIVSGVPHKSQPAASNISGLAASATVDTTNAGNISSGTLAVAHGGTGKVTFTTHGVLIGEGTGAVTSITPGTANTVLISNGGAVDPDWVSVSNLFDTVIGSATNLMMFRSGTGWSPATLGTNLSFTGSVLNAGTGSGLPGLADANLWIGNSSTVAVAHTISGDASLADTGALTVTKTGGAAFVASATVDTTSASNISAGTLARARGGTGLDTSTLSSGDLIIGGATGWHKAGLTAGSGMTIATSDGGITLSTSAGLPSLADGNIWIGNGSTVAAAHTISGDGSLSDVGALTVTKTNGTSFAASSTTDTTNAANISSGTLPAARLPVPGTSTLGGVQLGTPAAHQWISSFTTLGGPVFSQPAFTDVSGRETLNQMPTLSAGGHVYANIGTVAGNPTDTSLTSLLDAGIGQTVNGTLIRTSGSWTEAVLDTTAFQVTNGNTIGLIFSAESFGASTYPISNGSTFIAAPDIKLGFFSFQAGATATAGHSYMYLPDVHMASHVVGMVPYFEGPGTVSGLAIDIIHSGTTTAIGSLGSLSLTSANSGTIVNATTPDVLASGDSIRFVPGTITSTDSTTAWGIEIILQRDGI